MSDRFWDDTAESGPSSANTVRISSAARATILADGERSYPDECCGALFGPTATQIVEALSLRNVTTGERRRRFLIGTEEYRAAEKHADDTGRALLGFYHSHPDHPAEPSAFDLEHAWPNMSYVIVSVAGGQAGVVRSWRLRADRSGFDEEPLDRSAG